jgi:hypothetical protein
MSHSSQDGSNIEPNPVKKADPFFEKVLGFPAVFKLHQPKIDNMVEPQYPKNRRVTYKLQRSVNWTTDKLKEMSRWHPVDDNLHNYHEDNGHPIAASCRNIAEAWAISYCIKNCFNNDMGGGWLGDVGGNPFRHENAKRDYIHSICPTILPSDVTRERAINSCQHTWQECGCRSFNMTFSVHAAYYISPEDTVACIKRQKLKQHVAVVHNYALRPTQLHCGEITVHYGDMMEVRADGNIYSYHHPLPWWVGKSFVNVGNDTLCVTKLHSVGDDLVLLFTLVENKVIRDAATQIVDDRLDKICREHFKIYQTTDKYSLRSFTEVVAKHAVTCGFDNYHAQKYAGQWYKEQMTEVEKVTKITLTQEKAIEQHNKQLSTLTSRAGAWARFFHDNRALIYGGAVALPFVAATLFPKQLKPALATSAFTILSMQATEKLSIHVAVTDYCTTSDVGVVDANKCTHFPEYKKDKDCKPKLRAYPMLYVPSRIPAYPRNCYHNVYKAITNRMLNVTEVVPSAWDGIKWPKELYDVVEAAKTDLKPLQFEQWLERFDGKKQKTLLRQKENYNPYSTKAVNHTKCFLKFEATKNQAKYPRCICATDIEFNYQVGRWIVPLTEITANILDKNNRFYLPLQSHGEEIASYIVSMHDYVENDMSSFDSSQSQFALSQVYKFYRDCGVPDEVVEYLEKDLEPTEVETSVGIKFKGKNFRFSGRGDTLLGNTVLNLLIMSNAYPHVRKMIVKGDDSVVDAPFGGDREAESFITQLGFKPKISRTNIENVEFCSKLVVPVKGGHIMGPKIGRMLAKTFWCRNTNRKEDQMQQQLGAVVNGLRHEIECIPILSQLMPLAGETATSNPYALHNADEHEATHETYTYYANRYGITVDDLLGVKLQLKQFPYTADGAVIERIVDKDWGTEENRDLLVYKRSFDYDLLRAPVIEEVLKWYFGLPMAILIGGIESYITRKPYNLVMHVLLGMMPLPLAITMHTWHNMQVDAKLSMGPLVKSHMAKNKGKKSKSANKISKNQGKTLEQALGPIVRSALAKGLRAGGAYAGNFVAPGIGAAVGRSAGAGVSRILGFGDYTVSKNSLTHAPIFGKGNNEIRIKNREFITNVTGSTSFASANYRINPGNKVMFPWLNGIASSYQQYRVNGMIFHFNSTSADALNSTNTALGTVMLSTNYDLSEPNFETKTQVLAAYFSNSGKPSEDLTHAVECDMKSRPIDVLYVDHGGENLNSPQMYDLGNFQFATEGMQASAQIGELWVSYDITFYKPRFSECDAYTKLSNGAWSSTSPLGLIQTEPEGLPLPVSATGAGYDTIDLSAYAGKTVEIRAVLTGTSMVGHTLTVASETNITSTLRLKLNSASSIGAFGNGGGTCFVLAYDVPIDQTVHSKVQFGCTFTSGTALFVDLAVFAIES